MTRMAQIAVITHTHTLSCRVSSPQPWVQPRSGPAPAQTVQYPPPRFSAQPVTRPQSGGRKSPPATLCERRGAGGGGRRGVLWGR